MSNNYIVINGKRVEITEEQSKTFGFDALLVRKNPFIRVKPGSVYYYLDAENHITEVSEAHDDVDNSLHAVNNYFNDESFANQAALHQLLHRKLLKFAYDNECEDDQK